MSELTKTFLALAVRTTFETNCMNLIDISSFNQRLDFAIGPTTKGGQPYYFRKLLRVNFKEVLRRPSTAELWGLTESRLAEWAEQGDGQTLGGGELSATVW